MWKPRPVILEETEHASQKISRLSEYPQNLLDASAEITNLLFVSEDKSPSDVIFVFGAKPRP